MLNEAIDDDKSKKANKVCDDLSYHKFIPASWEIIVHEEVQKRLKIGNKNVIEKIKDEKRILSKKGLFLKVVNKNEMFQIKVNNNVLILLLKTNLKNHFDIPNESIVLWHNIEELLDIKSVLSYNIKNNIYLEVKYNDAKTIEGINLKKMMKKKWWKKMTKIDEKHNESSMCSIIII